METGTQLGCLLLGFASQGTEGTGQYRSRGCHRRRGQSSNHRQLPVQAKHQKRSGDYCHHTRHRGDDGRGEERGHDGHVIDEQRDRLPAMLLAGEHDGESCALGKQLLTKLDRDLLA